MRYRPPILAIKAHFFPTLNCLLTAEFFFPIQSFLVSILFHCVSKEERKYKVTFAFHILPTAHSMSCTAQEGPPDTTSKAEEGCTSLHSIRGATVNKEGDVDCGHQGNLHGKVGVIERPKNELDLEKQAMNFIC